MNALVLPIVHLNGTSREQLIEQQMEVVHALKAALAKLKEAAPNMRDYYPKPGLWDEAVKQHDHRVKAVHELIREISMHIDQLDYEGP